MKKGILIGIFMIAIIGVVILQAKFAAPRVNKVVQMEGHSVKTLMSQYYALNDEALEHIEMNLSELDNLIKESMNEAIAMKSVNAKTAQKRIAHMQRVSFLSLELMKAYEEEEGINFTKEQAEDLMLAAYLHDIRKYAEGNHAKQGAKYVLEKLPEYITIEDTRLERIRELIKYHSEPLSEKQSRKLGENAVLAQLLQDADAVDKIINQEEEQELDKGLNFESSVQLVNAYQSK